LYYLQSRYYNPEWGRFINADGAVGHIGNIQGHNMFQYCFNNPVMMSDPSGCWPKLSTILGVAAVVAVCVAVCVATGGIAACAIAAVSEGGAAILGGGVAAAELVEAASTVAIYAMATAGAAVAGSKAADSVERKLQPNHTVYKLVDSSGKTQYVGRTVYPDARAKAHEADPDKAGLTFEPIASGLNYYQARGMEQIGMLEYTTLNYKNKINGISPNNRNIGVYMAAGRGPALQYISNQISNEILNWDGK
jgi:hypothetical protein